MSYQYKYTVFQKKLVLIAKFKIQDLYLFIFLQYLLFVEI